MPNKTQSHLAAIAFRWSITTLCALWIFAPSASAQPAQVAKPASVDGVYIGTYGSEKDPTKFKLSLTQKINGILTGEFTLYVTDGLATKEYTCDLTGIYLTANRTVQVFNGKWKTAPPAGVNIRGMDGVFDPDGHQGAGQISGDMLVPRRGPKFEAMRDAEESAKLAKAEANKKDAEAPVTPVTPPGRRPTAINRTAPGLSSAPPSSPAPQPDTASPTAINGVYTGAYEVAGAVGVGGNFKAKLSFKATADGSLTGLFTFDLPASAGSRPATYKLTGKYVAGNRWPFRFLTVEPLGKPAPGSYTPKTLEACFEKGPLVAGRNGMEYSLNPDHISGPISGPAAVGFAAVRDKAESANLDKVMEAQATAATAASTTAPAAPTARPGIAGVFNGTYTREKGPPTKFKLTITRNQQGVTFRGVVIQLTGMATIYLPTDSGTKAYTYSLKGSEDPDGHGRFSLAPQDWATSPPKDVEDRNLKSMGFNGTLVLDPAQKTARIINVPEHDKDDIPTFEATWDATESSDIDGTIAAQKKVDAPELAAAVKERDEAVRNAPPKQLASKDLVRKSKKYWDSYETDMIREVFDGGFGAAVDENQLFQKLFCTYVEMYSAKYAALLPADHQTVTITRYTSKPDGNGGYIKTAVSSSAVEVDSRFAKKYRQFAEGLGSSANGAGSALAAMTSGASPRDMVNNMLAPVHDMQRFFANHDGKGAAMRQLTENFLRGVTGEPSLQQADGKIDGAQAETDKDLPPGRYARFVDAANAYFRERAKADPIRFGSNSSHDTAFCQRLAELYQVGNMSRDEEYYYANDFEGRYYPIMGPRASCPDPAWPRLNPAVEQAREQVR